MFVGFLLPVGCASPHVKTAVPNPFEIDPSEYGRVFQASVDVLHAEGFTLAREDYRFGRVTSMPLPSPTMLRAVENGEHHRLPGRRGHRQRPARIVTIRIDPSYAAAQPPPRRPPPRPRPTTQPVAAYRLRVDVEVQQAQFPDRRLSGSTSGPAIINVLRETPAELREQGIHGAYWQSVGPRPATGAAASWRPSCGPRWIRTHEPHANAAAAPIFSPAPHPAPGSFARPRRRLHVVPVGRFQDGRHDL